MPRKPAKLLGPELELSWKLRTESRQPGNCNHWAIAQEKLKRQAIAGRGVEKQRELPP